MTTNDLIDHSRQRPSLHKTNELHVYVLIVLC